MQTHDAQSTQSLPTRTTALIEAIESLGGVTQAALKLGQKQSTVSNWLARGQVSDTCASILAEQSGVACHLLRPDIFPAPKVAA